MPGLTKLPDTDFRAFEEKYHMTSDEYYQATQRQRALERQVRATKREIALGQERGLDMTEARYRLDAQQQRLRDHCKQTGLPRDPERERAYGVRQQPRALTATRHSSSSSTLELEEPREKKKAVKMRMTTEPVNLHFVESEHFERQFDTISGPKTRTSLVSACREMLSHRSGTVYEDFYAIADGSGEVLAKKTHDKTPHAVHIPPRIVQLLDGMRKNSVIVAHNHPQSMPPSVADFKTCLHPAVKHGVIVCHDGRAFTYNVVDADKFLAAIGTEEGSRNLDRTLSEMVEWFGNRGYDDLVVPTLEENYGITYSRLRREPA